MDANEVCVLDGSDQLSPTVNFVRRILGKVAPKKQCFWPSSQVLLVTLCCTNLILILIAYWVSYTVRVLDHIY